MIYRPSKPYHLDELKIKQLQWQRGMTNTDMARALKVSVATITRHLKNQRHNEIVQRGIARCLGTTLAEIAHRERRAS